MKEVLNREETKQAIIDSVNSDLMSRLSLGLYEYTESNDK